MNDPIGTHNLSTAESALLRKGSFNKVADLLLVSPRDAAKRCKSSPVEVQRIFEKVLNSVPLLTLKTIDEIPEEELFTTGDELLDKALGGGIRTGMVLEVVGESAAGKTQLALQLSLCVQAPTSYRGLSGAACYLTTSSTLPTTRLLQIAKNNNLLSIGCSLAGVHTISAPNVAVLQRVLTVTLPEFIEKQASDDKRHVKLLVIDALGELFHFTTRTTTSTLVERSKDISSISASLHSIATKYRVAILVLNEVIDVFNRPSSTSDRDLGDMVYNHQSRWFNTAEFFGEGSKEAALGLTWANYVNTRVMLSRTGRRRYFNPEEYPKRPHLVSPIQTDRGAGEEAEPTLIRRLSVLFSSVTAPISLDYIVTECGISIIQEDTPQCNRLKQIATVDQGIPDVAVHPETKPAILQVGDEFDQLWEQEEYQSIDWDALEMTLSQNV